MKIMTVVGARPQFIKLAPLSREIRNRFSEIIVHTGQHYDDKMSASFFRELEIPEPDYYLGVGSASHSKQTAEMLASLESICDKEKPDIIISIGDTNSTLAAALVAAKMTVRSVHIEAGLRSFNRTMPEEINRIIADHVSDLLFAPTRIAISNLGNEGLSGKAFLTGDIMVDSLYHALFKMQGSTNLNNTNKTESDKYYLVTLHRPYNVDNKDVLRKLLSVFSDLEHQVVFPLHPRTRKMILDFNISIGKNITFLEPQSYFNFIKLMGNSNMILTDSGGIQKEAYILKKPCITLRPETEWLETVNSGWNKLVDPLLDPETIIEQISGFSAPLDWKPLFGENVAKKMADLIYSDLSTLKCS